MAHEHHYAARLVWTGAERGSTKDYRSYSREYRVEIEGKPPLTGSADPTFLGDPAKHNPEDLLVASLAACHMLTYLAECARAGIEVVAYEDQASGKMAFKDRKMRDKVGAAFSTGGSVSAGKEFTILGILAAMLNNQMIVVSGGGGFGASATTGPDSPGLDENELASARDLGRRVAEVAALVRRGSGK